MLIWYWWENLPSLISIVKISSGDKTGGKVPLLLDHSPESGPSPKVVSDSAEIVKYVDANTPKDDASGSDLRCGYEGEASSYGSIFSLFAKYMKNKDPDMEETHKQALLAELEKFDNYLKVGWLCWPCKGFDRFII